MNSNGKILFFGDKNPPTYHEVPSQKEKLYQKILHIKKVISDDQRFENIVAINAYQEHLLQQQNISIMGQDHDASRKLVAYQLFKRKKSCIFSDILWNAGIRRFLMNSQFCIVFRN